MGVVIDPRRLHVQSSGDAGPVIAKACYVFDLGQWRKDWRRAEETKDYDSMDLLDRRYEMLGMP